MIRIPMEQDLKGGQAHDVQRRALLMGECLEALDKVLVELKRMPGIVTGLDRRRRPVIEGVIAWQFAAQPCLPILRQGSPLLAG